MKTADEIRQEAIQAANRSQFNSNYKYDHKSYEDGFFEGASQFKTVDPENRSALLKEIVDTDQEHGMYSKYKPGMDHNEG